MPFADLCSANRVNYREEGKEKEKEGKEKREEAERIFLDQLQDDGERLKHLRRKERKSQLNEKKGC